MRKYTVHPDFMVGSSEYSVQIEEIKKEEEE